jgi:hypothetical protein
MYYFQGALRDGPFISLRLFFKSKNPSAAEEAELQELQNPTCDFEFQFFVFSVRGSAFRCLGDGE